jgi:tRNA-splicing ligase RtcB (3'-phosphate/5'-hydroxy nucleic acid ligase)
VDDGALKQIKTCYYIFAQAAMMADHQKGYGVPIGGVIAHETLVCPSGVGYDIGCGNKAVLTDAHAADVRANIARIMDDVWNTISFGLARKNKEPVDHVLFDDNNDDTWQITQGANSATWKLTSLRDMARAQLGTVGSGNHYVDIFEDEGQRIWVGVHFGSRGFGPQDRNSFFEPRRRQGRYGLGSGRARFQNAGRPGLRRGHETRWAVCVCRGGTGFVIGSLRF